MYAWTKEELLAKLKELADKKNGETPGAKEFCEAVQMHTYHLKKLGWSCYSDLVVEAGLTPNEFRSYVYTKTELCDLFIETIREYKKWPSKNILDVKHFTDNKFPSSKTFYKQLGLTTDLAKSILSYIKDKEGFEDIQAICQPVADQHVENDTESDNQTKAGFVYLCKSGNNYRIGMTNNPERRQGEVGVLLVDPYELIHIIKTEDMRGVESYWHNRFRNKKVRGEWFKLSSSDVKAFKRWKKIF